MDWPLASDYASVLQNPGVAFVDPQLKDCQIRRNAHNQPHGVSGQFAVVFQAQLADGDTIAVRTFTSDREERTDRYRVISEYLEQMPDIPSLVRFQYTERGIRAITGGRARLYPLVTMDWVAGDSLFEWVQARCRAGQQDRLRKVAGDWVQLADTLEAAEIAHGDFQHGNVLVTCSDEMKLVDYDGMCVPALVGRRNLETGLPPYQHPRRNRYTPLASTLDRFSALLIYVALRALAAEPGLWSRFVESTGYDGLLFTAHDLAQSNQSELLESLRLSPDPAVARLSDCLLEAYDGAMDAVPRLTDVEESPALVSPPVPHSTPEPVEPSSPVASTAPLSHSSAPGPAPLEPEPSSPAPAASHSESAAPVAADERRQEPTPGVAPMLIALREGDRQEFCEHFDSRLISDHEEEFLFHRQLLVTWTRDCFRSRERIGLRPPVGRSSVSPPKKGNGMWQARWMWPHPRFSRVCVVGLTRAAARDDHAPDDLPLELRRTVTLDMYEGGRGIALYADRSTLGCHVVVWAVIDLGFERLYSEPLTLGAIRRSTGSDRNKAASW
ncbi:MAG: hypothetical protein ABIP48_15385 [Planctomycetota bacterium]